MLKVVMSRVQPLMLVRSSGRSCGWRNGEIRHGGGFQPGGGGGDRGGDEKLGWQEEKESEVKRVDQNSVGRSCWRFCLVMMTQSCWACCPIGREGGRGGQDGQAGRD